MKCFFLHHGGASAERHIRSQGPSQQSRQGARLRRVHVHPCCRLWPRGLSPRTRTQDAARVQVFSGNTGQASEAFAVVTTAKHAAQAGDPACEWKAEACGSQARSPEVERGVIVGGLGVVLLDYGEDVEANPQVSARESSSSADKGDRSIGATMA